MEKLAVVDLLNYTNSRYITRYMPLVLALGPENCVFYCSGSFADEYSEPHAALLRAGIEVVVDDYQRAKQHRYHLASSVVRGRAWKAAPPPLLTELDSAGTNFIYHPQSSEAFDPPAAKLPPGSFILYQNDHIFFNGIGAGKFVLDAQGRPEVGKADGGAEGVVVGHLHHTEETLALRGRNRAELRAELEEKMGVKFKPELPLVLFFVSHFTNPAQTDRGLERLAQQANVILKVIGPEALVGPMWGLDDGYSRARGENIFPSYDHSLNSLMRYAADVNLAIFQSSAFMSALMLGLRFIPVYSQRMLFVSPPELFNFNLWLRNANSLAVKIMWNISPINIESADMLMDRIKDRDYWERFDQAIGEIQAAHLGRFYLGDQALALAVSYIKRVLTTGTFAPADVNSRRVVRGPASLQPGLDFYHKHML